VIGVNFYPHNEWILSEEGQGFIRTDHPSYKPFRELLADVYARYKTPIYIAETGTEDEERVPWMRYVCQEVAAAIDDGIPIEGICVYPVIDRPDWENYKHWHHSGLWDMHRTRDGSLTRVLNPDYATELRRVQQLVPSPTGC